MKTDTELKMALAKMLPEKLVVEKGIDQATGEVWLCWRNPEKYNPEVLDTELLHVCWLVEETLEGSQCGDYWHALGGDWNDSGWLGDWSIVHATWQQRATALCKVKGIE